MLYYEWIVLVSVPNVKLHLVVHLLQRKYRSVFWDLKSLFSEGAISSVRLDRINIVFDSIEQWQPTDGFSQSAEKARDYLLPSVPRVLGIGNFCDWNCHSCTIQCYRWHISRLDVTSIVERGSRSWIAQSGLNSSFSRSIVEKKLVLPMTDTLDSVFVTLPTHTKKSEKAVFRTLFPVDDSLSTTTETEGKWRKKDPNNQQNWEKVSIYRIRFDCQVDGSSLFVGITIRV